MDAVLANFQLGISFLKLKNLFKIPSWEINFQNEVSYLTHLKTCSFLYDAHTHNCNFQGDTYELKTRQIIH